MGVQLELDLWQQLAVAEAEPGQTNVEQWCLGLDLMLAQGSPEEQLAVAGVAFFQIAEVFSRRAEVLLKDWQQAHRQEGPVLELLDLEGLVRRSIVVGLDDLMVEQEPVTRRLVSQGESVAAVVEKAVVLDLLAAEEQEAVLGGSEEEAVTDWVLAISRVLAAEGGVVSFPQLLRRAGLSGGQVFLGLLLGGFEFRRESKAFYGVGLVIMDGDGYDINLKRDYETFTN